MEERFEKVTGFAPYNSHSFSLPSLSSTLPLFEEIRKRSAQFTTLVQSVVLHSITEMCYNSFVLRNMCIFCKMFNWRDVVGFLCHNSILLNVIVIDFLMFRRVWLVCCLNLYVLETITLCFLVILILIILVSCRSKSQPVKYKSGNLKNVDLQGHSPFTGLVNLDMSHSCATADRPYVARC